MNIKSTFVERYNDSFNKINLNKINKLISFLYNTLSMYSKKYKTTTKIEDILRIEKKYWNKIQFKKLKLCMKKTKKLLKEMDNVSVSKLEETFRALIKFYAQRRKYMVIDEYFGSKLKIEYSELRQIYSQFHKLIRVLAKIDMIVDADKFIEWNKELEELIKQELLIQQNIICLIEKLKERLKQKPSYDVLIWIDEEHSIFIPYYETGCILRKNKLKVILSIYCDSKYKKYISDCFDIYFRYNREFSNSFWDIKSIVCFPQLLFSFNNDVIKRGIKIFLFWYTLSNWHGLLYKLHTYNLKFGDPKKIYYLMINEAEIPVGDKNYQKIIQYCIKKNKFNKKVKKLFNLIPHKFVGYSAPKKISDSTKKITESLKKKLSSKNKKKVLVTFGSQNIQLCRCLLEQISEQSEYLFVLICPEIEKFKERKDVKFSNGFVNLFDKNLMKKFDFAIIHGGFGSSCTMYYSNLPYIVYPTNINQIGYANYFSELIKEMVVYAPWDKKYIIDKQNELKKFGKTKINFSFVKDINKAFKIIMKKKETIRIKMKKYSKKIKLDGAENTAQIIMKGLKEVHKYN